MHRGNGGIISTAAPHRTDTHNATPVRKWASGSRSWAPSGIALRETQPGWIPTANGNPRSRPVLHTNGACYVWNIIARTETNGKLVPPQRIGCDKNVIALFRLPFSALLIRSAGLPVLGYVSRWPDIAAAHFGGAGGLWLRPKSGLADYDSQWFDDNLSKSFGGARWRFPTGGSLPVREELAFWPAARQASALTRVPPREWRWLGSLGLKTLQVTLPSKRETSPLSFAGAPSCSHSRGSIQSPLIEESRHCR